jgi:4-amino-4-deoxy-L-arabinose transferase-like glycosyltransferase
LWIVLALVTALRAVFAAVVELSPDEAYYWVWSRQLAAGYFDHPPAVAWWMRAGTSLLGDSGLGIRLPALLLGAGTSWMLFVLTRRLTGDARVAFWVALLVSASPLLATGSVIHTPDASLVLAWSLAIWFALRAFDRNRVWDWMGLGAAIGLACLSKSSGLLLVAGVGLYAVSCKAGRDCLRGPGPVSGLLVAGLVAAPNLIWNVQHQGGALLFQTRHVTDSMGLRPLGLLEFVGGQAGVVSPLLWLGLSGFLLLGWRRAVRFGRTEAYLLWCLSGPVMLGFALLSIFQRVEVNWPAVVYLAAVAGMAWCLTGGIWYLRRRRLWWALALALALGSSLLAHLQAVWPVLPLAPAQDPTDRLRGWRVFAEQVAADADALGAQIASEGYGPTSQLRFYTGRQVAYSPTSQRRSQYDLWPAPKLTGRLLFLQPLTSSGPPAVCGAERERWMLIREPAGDRSDKSNSFRWWVCEPVGSAPPDPGSQTDASRGS